MENLLYIKLHIMSPVHIGCDDVYEPTGFKFDANSKKLIAFDPLVFIESLSDSDRDKFASICMKGTIESIIELYRFISSKTISGREVDVSDDMISHYKKVKNISGNRIQQELNKFTISRTAYTPYIPGSSLKGSLRTAYLSMLAKEKKINNWKRKAKELEFELLGGKFETDPFRMIKVSDFLPVENVKTKIIYAVNKKKGSMTDAKGPFQILEVIQPGSVFGGVINIQEPDTSSDITNPIKKEKFLLSLRSFYGSGVNSKIIKQFNGADISPVRLGRHSGAEFVTIEGNRDIKINLGKGKSKCLDHATTIWLASESRKPGSNNGLQPFGWAVMELVDKPVATIDPMKFVVLKSAISPDTKQNPEPLPPPPPEPLINKLIKKIKVLKPTDAGIISTVIRDALEHLETEEDKKKFALAVKEHMGKTFKKSKAKKRLDLFIE